MRLKSALSAPSPPCHRALALLTRGLLCRPWSGSGTEGLPPDVASGLPTSLENAYHLRQFRINQGTRDRVRASRPPGRQSDLSPEG